MLLLLFYQQQLQIKMIKELTILPVIRKQRAKSRQISKANIENVKPVAFNTKGYFDLNQPFNEDYLTLKQKVFQKYRNQPDEEIVMIDMKNPNKSAFIQRGCLLPIKQNNNNRVQQTNTSGNNPRTNLLKNYLNRKEKRLIFQNEKYSETPKINVEILQSRISDTSKNSLHHSKILFNTYNRLASQTTIIRSQYEL